mmetsp:Transcript_110151/g.310587  ORF Transcript_110151/g.310587 Transcript_110151/m.310587 type:complete len:250 (+) Transcript_110151:604-1353(+)
MRVGVAEARGGHAHGRWWNRHCSVGRGVPPFCRAADHYVGAPRGIRCGGRWRSSPRRSSHVQAGPGLRRLGGADTPGRHIWRRPEAAALPLLLRCRLRLGILGGHHRNLVDVLCFHRRRARVSWYRGCAARRCIGSLLAGSRKRYVATAVRDRGHVRDRVLHSSLGEPACQSALRDDVLPGQYGRGGCICIRLPRRERQTTSLLRCGPYRRGALLRSRRQSPGRRTRDRGRGVELRERVVVRRSVATRR